MHNKPTSIIAPRRRKAAVALLVVGVIAGLWLFSAGAHTLPARSDNTSFLLPLVRHERAPGDTPTTTAMATPTATASPTPTATPTSAISPRSCMLPKFVGMTRAEAQTTWANLDPPFTGVLQFSGTGSIVRAQSPAPGLYPCSIIVTLTLGA